MYMVGFLIKIVRQEKALGLSRQVLKIISPLCPVNVHETALVLFATGNVWGVRVDPGEILPVLSDLFLISPDSDKLCCGSWVCT